MMVCVCVCACNREQHKVKTKTKEMGDHCQVFPVTRLPSIDEEEKLQAQWAADSPTGGSRDLGFWVNPCSLTTLRYPMEWSTKQMHLC